MNIYELTANAENLFGVGTKISLDENCVRRAEMNRNHDSGMWQVHCHVVYDHAKVTKSDGSEAYFPITVHREVKSCASVSQTIANVPEYELEPDTLFNLRIEARSNANLSSAYKELSEISKIPVEELHRRVMAINELEIIGPDEILVELVALKKEDEAKYIGRRDEWLSFHPDTNQEKLDRLVESLL